MLHWQRSGHDRRSRGGPHEPPTQEGLASLARLVASDQIDDARSTIAYDSRLVALTFANALLYWPWHWLRIAFDAGDRHPMLVLGMMLLTLWLWAALVEAVLDRFKGVKRRSQGGSPGRDL